MGIVNLVTNVVSAMMKKEEMEKEAEVEAMKIEIEETGEDADSTIVDVEESVLITKKEIVNMEIVADSPMKILIVEAIALMEVVVIVKIIIVVVILVVVVTVVEVEVEAEEEEEAVEEVNEIIDKDFQQRISRLLIKIIKYSWNSNSIIFLIITEI